MFKFASVVSLEYYAAVMALRKLVDAHGIDLAQRAFADALAEPLRKQ